MPEFTELACVMDCRDADRLADFWAALLGYRRGRFNPPYVSLRDPAGRNAELLLQQVPEPKAGKNRLHLDLRLASMEPALSDTLRLGARVVRGPFDDSGWLTTVLTDPEGNEFCLLVPPRKPRDQNPEARAGTTA